MEKLLYVFALWANLESGEQVELARSTPMPIEQCEPMQRQIWETDFPIVAFTDREPIPSVDAACIPYGLLQE